MPAVPGFLAAHGGSSLIESLRAWHANRTISSHPQPTYRGWLSRCGTRSGRYFTGTEAEAMTAS